MKTIVWDENPPHADPKIYPDSMRGAIAEALGDGFGLHIAHQDEPDQGVPEELLAAADCLVWWGHIRQGQVADDTVERIVRHVTERGMGFVALHSANQSHPLRALLGGEGASKGGWDDSPQTEVVRVAAPWHPIAEGLDDFVIEGEEMYGGPLAHPMPEALILQSHFPKHDKSYPCLAVWTVGNGRRWIRGSGPGQGVGQGEGVGRVVYFRPGHETADSYRHPMVGRALQNAVRWASRRPN